MESWLRKRTRAKYILITQFVVFGIEYSIVYPTLVFYLQELKTSHVAVFLGATLASFCLSGMIFALTLGRMADVTLRFRNIVLVINLITLIGNALYTVGISPYVILVARFLCGASDALYPVAYGEFGKCFTTQEFNQQAGHLMIGFCVGLCIGPGFNMIPTDRVVDIGLITIRYTNLPGVILFCATLILLIVSFFGLSNLSLEKLKMAQDHVLSIENPEKVELKKHIQAGRVYTESNDVPTPTFDEDTDFTKRDDTTPLVIFTVKTNPWRRTMKEFFSRLDIAILLYGQVTWAYYAVSVAPMLAMVAVKILHFKLLTIAFFYLGAGLIMSVVLVCSRKLLFQFSTVTIAIVGFVVGFASSISLYLSILAQDYLTWLSYVFLIIFAGGFFVAWCLNSITLKSILSERVAFEDQSFSQGIFSSVEYTVSIFAGLTVGPAFETLIAYVACCSIMNLVAVALFSFYFKTLSNSNRNPSRIE